MEHGTVEGLRTTVQKTNEWLKEISDELAEDEQVAYHALRAVLHALRDRLTVEEAADLGAQLPMLIRGIFYEGWSPSATPIKQHREEFLETIARCFKTNLPHPSAERAARAVFGALARHVTAGEVRDVCSILPADLRDLWPRGATRPRAR